MPRVTKEFCFQPVKEGIFMSSKIKVEVCLDLKLRRGVPGTKNGKLLHAKKGTHIDEKIHFAPVLPKENVELSHSYSAQGLPC